MKKETLLASLLLTSSASQLTVSDILQAQELSLEERQDLIDMIFKSQKKATFTKWVQGEDGRYEPVSYQNWAEITLLQANHDNYDYEGEGSMSFEVVIREYIEDEEKGIHYNDYNYYAKKVSDHKYILYDCDSTSVCWDEYNNTTMYIFDTPQGKVLKIKDPEEVILDKNLKVFYEHD